MSDEAYLKALLAKIAEHEREKQMQAALHHSHSAQERRRYLQTPEVITALAPLGN